MERYCHKCKETRDFDIKSKSGTETVYECSRCDFQYKDKTMLGWGLAAGGLVLGAIGLFGGGHHNDHNS